MSIDVPSVEECVLATEITADKWPMNCHAVAMAICNSGLLPGFRPTYGHYFGEIADDSPFGGRVFPRHGWAIHKRAGVIVDPTRWVFESRDPYIFACEKGDSCWDDYDMGGERFQTALGGHRRFPHDGLCAGENQRKYENLSFAPPADEFVKDVFGHDDWLYQEQMFWLANASPNALEELAVLIYDTIMAEPSRRGWIPVDYRNYVYGG